MKKTGLVILSLSFLFLIFACNNADKTNDTENTNEEVVEVEVVDEDFSDFYEKFVSNEDFQLERVSFPVEGARILDYDLEEEWTHENWRVLTDIDEIDKNEFAVEVNEDENRVEHKVYLPNSGFGIFYAFQKIEGEWYLTERTDMSL